ncbi:MAG: hypothetical protein ACKO7N_04540 [Candidatus Nitrosotenuis sp.]
MKYTIDSDCFIDEGGSAEFYLVKENPRIGFKQFRNKKTALRARQKQYLLSKHNLAPKVLSKLCKLQFDFQDYKLSTNWGFLTERAKLVDEKIMSKRMAQIQKLVKNIYDKTKLKFWDCHYYNVGYIKRNNRSKLVCIDTGNESFLRDSNAWGFNFPGPKCTSCKRYQCICA